MTVSELINKLQLLVDQEDIGDDAVHLAVDEEGNDFRPVHEVTFDGLEVVIWPY